MYNLWKFSFRGTYAGGFRTPTLSELYATNTTTSADRINLSNPNLKPEKSDYASFGVEFTHNWLSVSGIGFIIKFVI